MYYLEVLEELHKNNINYLLVGGLAVNLYGIPRITQDIDLILRMNKENLIKAVSILKNLGYITRLAVNPEGIADESTREMWINEKNMIAFSFYNNENSFKVVDIIIKHNLDFDKSFASRTVLEAGNIEISLASIDDIISMKKISGREQDISDIRMLSRIKDLTGDSDG